MRILIVGGTGMIGNHAAVFLKRQGNLVTLAARKPGAAGTPAASFPTIIGDYTKGSFSLEQLSQFDAVIFSAGADVREIPAGVDQREFWTVTQSEGIPKFAALAKSAGVKRFLHIGSLYIQAHPKLVETSEYVRSRKLAQDEVAALSGDGFEAFTLNPPSIVGAVSGVPQKRYEDLMAWAHGDMPDVGAFAPPGGNNFMSVRSLSEAIWGALQHAEAGKSYLIGDENLTYLQFFRKFFRAAGCSREIEERNEEHPIWPDRVMMQGRGTVIAYEPDPDETALLGYRRGDVDSGLAEVVREMSK